MNKLVVASHIKKVSPSIPIVQPEALNCAELNFGVLISNFRIFLDGFLPRLLLFGGW